MATVIAYGTSAAVARTLPTVIDHQLHLAHRLREDLVDTAHRREAALAALWSAQPHIAALEARLADLDLQIAETATEARRERAAAGSRRVDTPAGARLQTLRAARKQAAAARRAAIGDVRGQVRELSARAYATERDEIRALYATYCQLGVPSADGQVTQLYWATFNDVVAHHRTAVKRIAADRANAQASRLRHHRFNGSGTLAVQLQREAGDPARTPALLASGNGPWRNVLVLQGQSRDATVRMRVGGGVGGEIVTIPINAHRPLPPDADITGARLVVRRVAGHRTVALHITAWITPPPPVDPRLRPIVAVHLGWRAERGGVRVATWRATAPLTVPDELRDTVNTTATRSGTVLLSVGWRARMRRVDQIRSQRDRALAAVRTVLAEHLRRRPASAGEDCPDATDVESWSFGRFADLARRWRDRPPPGREALAADLEAWRRRDRRRWEAEAHGRGRALRCRDDSYARVAAWLAEVAGLIVVDDISLPSLARRDPPGTGAVRPELAAAAATQRTHAAAGIFRSRIVATARRSGVAVHVHPHRGLSRTHADCGHVNPPHADYSRRFVVCRGCGKTYDQDASATQLMLDAAARLASSESPRTT